MEYMDSITQVCSECKLFTEEDILGNGWCEFHLKESFCENGACEDGIEKGDGYDIPDVVENNN